MYCSRSSKAATSYRARPFDFRDLKNATSRVVRRGGVDYYMVCTSVRVAREALE